MNKENQTEMVQIPQYVLDDSPILQEKLKQYQEAETRANKAIALVGTAEEVQQLRIQVKQELDLATVATADTRAQCELRLSEARDRADKILSDANHEALNVTAVADDLTGASQAMHEAASMKLQNARKLEAEVNDRAKLLDTREIQLANQSEELKQTTEQLLQEKSALVTVREEIDKILPR